MYRKFLKSKIHRATVTQADLHYEGSITLPPKLMKAADIAEFESVHVWNVTAGTRLETYAISGKNDNNNDICINGAAAHLVTPGDIVIIACFALLKEGEFSDLQPTVIFVDGNNQLTGARAESPGPQPPA
jgi:aspartate 1-decarboxylase